MAYQKVPRPSTVYHLTKKEHLDSILDDGVIRRFNDTECWFCESLDKMKAYMGQTVLCEGKPYYAVGGQLCRYPKFVPEDYVLLKLTPSHAKENLDAVGWQVDYIITHCAPTSIALMGTRHNEADRLTDFQQEVRERAKYHYWLFGHYHDNKAIDEKHILLWEQIVRVI